MDELRYGVIGTGMMGVEHIENVNALDGAVVTAIADPHPQSRDAGQAAAAGSVQVYADHQALLDSGSVDAVVVASPNMTHIEVLRDVLATDIPVLIEKPMCTTVEDCKEVIELAEEALAGTQDFFRLFLVPGMGHCRGGPGYDTFDALGALEAWVEEGVAPGTLEAVDANEETSGRTRPVCHYPRWPRYDGSGSLNAAENFDCVDP